MSEETPAPAPDSDEGGDFEAITSQDALDKIIGARIDRVKKQFADYKDLKAKATKFDELETANKTELQQLQERYTTLESELANERLTTRRTAYAAEKGVPTKALTGDTEEEWQACVDELLSWRGDAESVKSAKSARGLKSGATNTDPAMDDKDRAAQAVRRLFSRQ